MTRRPIWKHGLPADTVWVLPGLSDFRDMLSSAERLWTEAFEAQDVEGRPQPQRLAMREASDVESACRAPVRLCSRRTAGDGHRQRNP